jgi:hypothetical protein
MAGAGGGGGAGGAQAGFCTRGCATPADCCPPGAPNCPSNQYPTNYTCESGICGPPQCQSNVDCISAATPNNQCVGYNGINQCVTPCTLDAECSSPAVCTGVDDGGNKFCKAEAPPFMCDSDMDCNGFGQCNAEGNGCVCFQDTDCSGFVNKCAPLP